MGESAVDAAFDEIQITESQKMDKAIKAVKDALDKAHTGIMIRITVKPLYDILSDYDREKAILLISQFIKKYEKIINMITPITGKWVVYAENPYADKSDEHIKNDVKFTIFIVYFATISEEGVKAAVTKALKGIFGSFKIDNK